MTRDIKDIITDMREIVKPCIAQMLFNENFEGKGNTDKAEFETEFEMLLTLAERGATVEPQEWISLKEAYTKGEWLFEPTQNINNPWKCSCCGHRAGRYKYKTYKFCPWCGAKMDKGVAKNDL